ncbi:MAG: hypothetical protein R2712_29235 [Vicinamibacterales bacterium]
MGDSRIYRWRSGVEQLTTDDTWLSTVMGLTADDGRGANHPLKHVLTRVVGTRDDLQPTVREEDIEPGDCFVLCSDGVHGRLDGAAIAAVLRARPDDVAGQAEGLVAEAIARHTTDNATALVVAAG